MAPRRRFVRPPRDEHGLYRAACGDLAEAGGWYPEEVWSIWEQLAMMREFEMKVPRAIAEAMALSDVRAVYDKRGSVAS